MKQLDLSPEHIQMINNLCNLAFKGVGLDAYNLVKQIDAWLQTAIEKACESKE